MSALIKPQNRVFRIGRECYITYLGSDRGDVSPFLRIGNRPDLPKEILDAVSATIITDNHVGSPLLEILYGPRVKGRYIGDTDVVSTIRRFFKSFELPTDDIADYHQVKDRERRHMVWFYSSGNIHLRYDDQVIFDLNKREREDGHFVRCCDAAKEEFLHNPLRYIRQDFNGPGLILSGGNAYWFENEELLSIKSGGGFFNTLLPEGIDPDLISTMAIDWEQNAMASDEAQACVGFIKRVRQLRKKLRVISPHPALQRKIKLLFPARGATPATVNLVDVSDERKTNFFDSFISKKGKMWQIHRTGLPEISFAAKTKSPISVDIEKSTILVETGSGKVVFSPPFGFPINFFGGEAPHAVQIIHKHISYLLPFIKDHLVAGEAKIVEIIDDYLGFFANEVKLSEKTISTQHKQFIGKFRDATRRFSSTGDGPTWFLYSNAISILRVFIVNLGKTHILVPPAQQMEKILEALLRNIPAPNSALPFWGDLYLEGSPVLLWRVTKRSFTTTHISLAKDLNKKIDAIMSPNEALWQEDRGRLLRLIKSLSQGGQGPLTKEQIILLGGSTGDLREDSFQKSGKLDHESREVTAVTGTPSLARKKDDGMQKKKQNSRPSSSKSSWMTQHKGVAKKGRKERKKVPLLVAMAFLPLILLVAGWLWERLGTAPWGKRLSNFTQAERQENDLSHDVNTKEKGSDQDVVVLAIGSSPDSPLTLSPEKSDQVDKLDSPIPSSPHLEQTTDNPLEGRALDEIPPVRSEEGMGSVSPPLETNLVPLVPAASVNDLLRVEDRVIIDEVDIHLMANEIATVNGYKDLDFRVYTGDDPNWIYPSNILKMPSGEFYEVQKNDTIWVLAVQELQRDRMQNLLIYDGLILILDEVKTEETKITGAVVALRHIMENSRVAAMRDLVKKEFFLRGL